MHIFLFVAHFVEAFPSCPQQATETTNELEEEAVVEV